MYRAIDNLANDLSEMSMSEEGALTPSTHPLDFNFSGLSFHSQPDVSFSSVPFLPQSTLEAPISSAPALPQTSSEFSSMVDVIEEEEEEDNVIEEEEEEDNVIEKEEEEEEEEEDEVEECSVPGCEVQLKAVAYGHCSYCCGEPICSRQDEEHENFLKYHQSQSKVNGSDDIHSLCPSCIETCTTRESERHCFCPLCRLDLLGKRTCHVKGCTNPLILKAKWSFDSFDPGAEPDGWCECCRVFAVCNWGHRNALLHHVKQYTYNRCEKTLCIPCSLKYYKMHLQMKGMHYVEDEAHCYCCCGHDFGLLKDLDV